MRPARLVVGAAVVLASALAGCASYPDINGQLALARDGQRTLVLIHTCSGAVEDLEVHADRQGLRDDQPNPSLGALHATTPVSGDVTVDLSAPGPQWEVRTPVTLPAEPDKGIIVSARHASADTEVQQTDTHIGQLTALKPGTVIVGGDPDRPSGRVVTEQEFRTGACKD